MWFYALPRDHKIPSVRLQYSMTAVCYFVWRKSFLNIVVFWVVPRTISLCLLKQIIYGGLQEISEEFSEELESGKAVAKLMLYKPPENKEILQPSGTNDAAEPEESTGEDNVLAAETDAIFGAMKVIYGCCPTEGGQPPNMDPER